MENKSKKKLVFIFAICIIAILVGGFLLIKSPYIEIFNVPKNIMSPIISQDLISSIGDFDPSNKENTSLEYSNQDFKVEIGEPTKQDNVVISRWDESKFIINFPTASSDSISDKSDKASISYSNYDIEHYMKDSDNYEFDIILNTEPKDLQIAFDIDLENLVCTYQPPLNEEENNYTHCNETDCWWDDQPRVNRPMNIVGTYACYHNSKKGNKYMVGKAFHIYKAIITDNDGKKHEVELEIDSKLSIPIPKGLPYPIRVDPVFGKTGVGSTLVNIGIYTIYTKGTTGSNGSLQTIYWYGANDNASRSWSAALYDDDGGSPSEPDNLLENESYSVTADGTRSWETFQMADTTSLSPNTDYWLGITHNGSAVGTDMKLNYDTVSNQGARTDYNESWKDPTGTVTMYDREFSAYAYYKPTACNTTTEICKFESGHILEDLQYSAGDPTLEYGGIIKWDVSELCSLSPTIYSAYAQFWMTRTGSPDNDVRPEYINNESWTEGDSATNLDDMPQSNITTETLSSTTTATFTNFSVTTQLAQACANSNNNFTFIFEDPDNLVATSWGTVSDTDLRIGVNKVGLPPNINYYNFAESETLNFTQRPVLWVNYTTIAGDTTDPVITLLNPADNNETSSYENTFICNVSDDTDISNVSLWTNWSGSWHRVETNTSGTADVNYSFTEDLENDFQNQSDGFPTATAGSATPRSITTNGSDFWIIDEDDDWVYHFDTSGTNITDGFSVSGTTSRGITYNDSDFFVTDYTGDKVLQINLSGDNTVNYSISASGNNDPRDITTNGSDYWIMDSTDKFIYHYNSTFDNQTGGCDVDSIGAGNPSGLTSNSTDFWIPDLTDNFIYHINSSCDNQTDGIDISDTGTSSPIGITNDEELTIGRPHNFYIADSGDDFIFHLATTTNGDYLWNCEACDSANNCAFASANRTIIIYSDHGILITPQYPTNNSYNRTSEIFRDLTCYINSTSPISEAWFTIEKYYGGWYVHDTYNVTEKTGVSNNANMTLNINLTNGFYRWKCNATNSLGNSNESLDQTHKTGKGEVYIDHPIHAEPKGSNVASGGFDASDLAIFNHSLNLDDFTHVGGKNVFDVMKPSWRDDYYDSYGTWNTMTWAMRMDPLICESVQGCSAITNIMLTNATANYSQNITFYNDTIAQHYHHMDWYNWTNYSGGGTEPYQPAQYWNQILTFNGTIYRNQSDIELMNKMLAIHILDTETYSIVSVYGWLYENTDMNVNFSNKYMPFTHNNYYNHSGVNLTEPTSNNYNWSIAPYEMYHPNISDYQSPGDLNNIIIPCGPGGLDDDVEEYNRIVHAFELADNGTNIILCHYTHTYQTNGIESDTSTLHTCLNDSRWGSCARGGVNGGMNDLFPEVNYVYTTNLKAIQAVMDKTDTTSPTLELWINGEWAYVNSTEELWNPPALAIKNTTSYYLGNLTVNETHDNTWQINITPYNTKRLRAAGIDTSYNFNYSDLAATEILIQGPTEEVPVSASTGENISINFTMTDFGEYITSGVNVVNVSIGSTNCTWISSASYLGTNLWEVNCTLPDLTGDQDLTVWGNHTDTGILEATENNAVSMSCWSFDSVNKFLSIPIGCLFENALGELFGDYFLALFKKTR